MLSAKSSLGLLDIDEVIARLPRELRRSQPALSGHIAAGGLVPTENEFGLLLFSESSVKDYVTWLRQHPDGRLTRFNAIDPRNAEFVRTWTKNRHGGTAARAVSGRLARELAEGNDHRVGRVRQLTAEQQQRIRQLHASGGNAASVRAIARAVGVPKGRVERFLSVDKLSRNP
jgi:hypothetical protein